MDITVVCVLVLAVLVSSCDASRILVFFPAPGKSHAILGDSVSRLLADAGHEVVFITTHPKEENIPGLKYVNISSTIAELKSPKPPSIDERARSPRPMSRLVQFGSAAARAALLHPAMHDLLMDRYDNFDLVIAEWFFSELAAPLAGLYSCPLIWYSSTDSHWQTLRLVHEATSAAYSVDMQAAGMPALPFSIQERARQLWYRAYMTAWVYYTTHFLEIPAYEEIFRTPFHLRGQYLPAFEDLSYNGSLLLLNSHPPLAQPLPLPQNAKYVGGHHIDIPTKPLPKDLQRLLDKAKHGVIYFSMGSNLKSTDFPEKTKRDLVKAFAEMQQTVIWKFEEQLEDLPRNIHILNWAPQHSILEHPNVVLFITHGGQLSLLEATHYGVPIIGIPFFGDQPVNVDLAVRRGVGRRVDFTNDLPFDIKEAVYEILLDKKYRENAKAAMREYHRRMTAPQTELLHWVQLVLDTRGAAHLRSPAVQLTALQALHLDILFLLILFFWFLSKVVKVIQVHRKPVLVKKYKKDN